VKSRHVIWKVLPNGTGPLWVINGDLADAVSTADKSEIATIGPSGHERGLSGLGFLVHRGV
jgi:hypothetical protein